jgi:hypothetical protein
MIGDQTIGQLRAEGNALANEHTVNAMTIMLASKLANWSKYAR